MLLLRILKSCNLAPILTAGMHRSLLLFLLSFFACISLYGQSAKPDCRNFIAGTFFKDNTKDSVIVFRGLEYWIEADIKNHECRVYKTSWTDDCDFMLIYNNTITQDKSIKFYKRIDDTLMYSSESFDSNGINYLVKSSSSVGYHKLHYLTDTIAWLYLIDADSNLYFDTTEIKYLYGLPLSNYNYNVPYFLSLQTGIFENQFVAYVVSLFKSGDVKPAFNYASRLLKAHSPDAVLNDYNVYASHLYGKLLTYQPLSVRDGYRLGKTNSFSHTYIIQARFEKLTGPAEICLSTAPDINSPLLSLNVVVDSVKKIPYIIEMTKSFWASLKHRDFKGIYDSSSSTLKAILPYSQAQSVLNSIDSIGHLDDYKLYFENFTVNKDRGLIITSYKCELPNKSLSLSLMYLFENGEYKLAGLNAPKI
jgi:hypothetical protein